MKQEAMQKHPEEWFFLHNFDVDRVFSTIRRTDYLVLFYIKMRQESHPDEKLYLADLAAEMGVKVTELSKGIEKLQDQGYVRWLTDREAGRTYVELTSKAVELMAEERDFMKRCYARLRTELGDEELRRTVDTLQHMLRSKIQRRKRPRFRVWKRGLCAFGGRSAVAGRGRVHDLAGGHLVHGRGAEVVLQCAAVGGEGIFQLVALHVAQDLGA